MSRIVNRIKYLPITIPLVFVIVFFGFFPVRFDAIIYTDNIVGEGTCEAFLSSDQESFAYLYDGNAYFGSELKTLRLRDIRYNVNEVNLYVFDVKEADVLSFDISIFGYTVTHVNGKGLTHPFTKTVSSAVVSSEKPIIHMVLDDPDEGCSLSLSGFDFIPFWFWVIYFVIIVLVSILISLILSTFAEKHSAFVFLLFSASAVMISLLAGAFYCGSYPYIDYTYFLLNWAILFSVALFINALSLPWIGTVTVSLFTSVWYIVNYYVITFRGKPIMPADLRAISTAMEVANGYSFVPTWQMIISNGIVVLYCICLIIIYRKKHRKKISFRNNLIYRGASVVVSVLIIFCAINSNAFANANSFAWDARVMESFHREGIVLSFMKNLMNSIVRKPEGYSRELVNGFLSKYKAEKKEGVQPLNVIMIMNEAFSDLRTVGLDDKIDVMQFIDSLDDNTTEGKLYVSVLGGGTCNTEFEALTGNSMAFLGIGSYPYTSNITKPLFSLASYFGGLGYVAESFHSNESTNWNRKMVYPLLGFDKFHDIKDILTFSELKTLHNLPSDEGDYNYMESIEKEYDRNPTFLFDVTMQNHSDYDHFEDVKEDKTVEKYGKELAQPARVYLSLIKASDDAIKQLIERYQKSEEPTMIVFFGDHQPGMTEETRKGVYNDIHTYLDYYKTKFFIWTNYETETEHDVQISANYLPWLILERGNFDLPPYIQMLKELHEKYPIISAQGVIDAEGNVYTGVAEVMDDPLIKKYQYIQYANMFDEIDPAWFEVN